MEMSKIKLPLKGGSRKASEIFENSRRKAPSDRLVKIISEIPELKPVKKPSDRAAKDLGI